MDNKNLQIFRVSKRLFYISVVSSLILCILIIGIPMLAYFIIWYKTTSITLGEDGVRYRTGWLTVKEKYIPYETINAVDTQADIFGNMMGYGDLKISVGNDLNGLTIKGIENVKDLQEKVTLRIHKKNPLKI